nr:hypothetical protein BaRGS_002382 [Batillaria attramentaria]
MATLLVAGVVVLVVFYVVILVVGVLAARCVKVTSDDAGSSDYNRANTAATNINDGSNSDTVTTITDCDDNSANAAATNINSNSGTVTTTTDSDDNSANAAATNINSNSGTVTITTDSDDNSANAAATNINDSSTSDTVTTTDSDDNSANATATNINDGSNCGTVTITTDSDDNGANAAATNINDGSNSGTVTTTTDSDDNNANAAATNINDGSNSGTVTTADSDDTNSAQPISTHTALSTTVGGGFINGTAESITTGGLAWTISPFAITVGLIIGGMVYAAPMREARYLTMLQPVEEQYGRLVVCLVYLASLCGDVFWTASILNALGTSLSVVIGLNLETAILVSAAVTVFYTMVGQMISVAYTDVLQLLFMTLGLVLCLPFIATDDRVGDFTDHTDRWSGQLDGRCRFSLDRPRDGHANQSSMVLPLMLKEFTPDAVSIIGLGAVSAAVMSSMDSAVLGSSSMFTHNVYKASIRPKMAVVPHRFRCFGNRVYMRLFRLSIFQASDSELLWVQRIAILIIGAASTAMSIYIQTVWGLFVLAADIVYVIVLPQLTSALFIRHTNAYGAVVAFVVGAILRIGAGEPYLNLKAFIKYPYYDEDSGEQVFPFRGIAFLASMLCLCLVSWLTNLCFTKGLLPSQCNVLGGKGSVPENQKYVFWSERNGDKHTDEKQEGKNGGGGTYVRYNPTFQL